MWPRPQPTADYALDIVVSNWCVDLGLFYSEGVLGDVALQWSKHLHAVLGKNVANLLSFYDIFQSCIGVTGLEAFVAQLELWIATRLEAVSLNY